MKKTAIRIVGILAILTLLVCTAFAANDNPVIGIRISDENVNLSVGGTKQLQVEFITCEHPADARAEVPGAPGDKPATCTENGQQTYSCSQCNTQFTEVITASGHSWQKGDATTDGKFTYTCSKCNEVVESVEEPPKDYTSEDAATDTQTLRTADARDNVSISWASDHPDIVSVSATGIITANKLGTATITATYGEFKDTATVNVTASTIQCSNTEVELGDTFTLSPTVPGIDNANITYSYTVNSSKAGSVSPVSGKNGTFKGTNQGQAKITIHADAKVDGETITIPDKDIYVGIYDETAVKAVVEKSKFYLNDDEALGTVNVDGKTVSYDISLFGAMNMNDSASIKLDSRYTSVGEFSKDTITTASTFTVSQYGESTVYYTIYSDKNCKVGEGTLTLTVGDVSGAINYSTDHNTKLTFDASDFISFWNKIKSENKFTSSLDYVRFTDGSKPEYGQIYTDSSAKYTANTNYKFKADYRNEPGYYDLDKVTYVPESKNYAVTSVTIPFEAVGTKDTEYTSGVVIIDLNGDGVTISSRGVRFGADKGKITELMADVFKAKTNATLSYVTFPDLDPETGKLFSNFTSMLDSTQVTKNWQFYVSSSNSKDLKLDDVVFVPRAGLSGKATIYFVGYSGNNQGTTCSITFNVLEKSKSDVFSDVTSSSYSWAADAVDFLYYEGVANGSNGKYNPASNITRGDFMLMLYRAFLEDEYEDYNVTSNFPDVVKGTTTYSQETYQAVGVAKYLGIAKGSNGKFNPKAYITREEAMTLIYRTLDKAGYSMSYTVSASTSSFKDYSSVSSYAQTAIKDLIGHGVVVGTNGKINPKSNITRAEMAVILHRVLTY